ncbi:MAG: calcineurin-like phosphoesterase C-terminal domain-containing protein, partial [Bacteroidales bacterium]
IHYVTLKNVFYIGKSYNYMGYIDGPQLDWLKKDLSTLKAGSTVIVSLHIPTTYGDSETETTANAWVNSVLNKEALYNLLKRFDVHIMAGHSHTQWNTQITPNILEHTHAAASAAWWQGEVGLDGTPKGYTVYEIQGEAITWYFKGIGMDKQEQLRVYRQGDTIIANVFNFDPNWKVRYAENGVDKGLMQKYWGVDPLAKELYPEGGNKVHTWLHYGETGHLFRAILTDSTAKIEIIVTDRFGKQYKKTL